jgi:nucleotide-binding universal stress UspA family protein
VHVLIGTDGSQLAVRAAQHGLSLLVPPDHVTVLTVIDKVPVAVDEDWESFTWPAWPDDQDRQWHTQIAQAQAALGRTAAALAGVRVEERLEGGDVARTICNVARELGVDVIVIGSHARAGIGRLVVGSVSEHVVRRAPCPVLVVRADGSSLNPSPSPPSE